MNFKEIMKALPNDKDFRKWFLDNLKELVYDINGFFKKFNGGELTLESIKPLVSWSVNIPKEHKMRLYNMLAELNGQKVLASYGIKDSEFNKVLKDALKENSDIEATDEIKAYVKINFNEFYSELFKILKTYEHLGTKSAEPIAKMLANKLGAEKGRPIRFCEEFRKYLVELLKNVIDSINNNMKNYEKPITASSDNESVSDILCSLFNEFSEECHKRANNVLESFSSNSSKLFFDVKISNNLSDYFTITTYWTAQGINVSLVKCTNNECREMRANHFSLTDFTGLKKELYDYLDLIEKELNKEKVNVKLKEEPKVELREIDNSDLNDICRIILNDESYSNALKAKANLYLSLLSANDINSDYMKTLADSILAGYKNTLSTEIQLNDVLSSIKNMIETKFKRNGLNFSNKGENTLLVFVKSSNSFDGEFCIEFTTKDTLCCVVKGMKVLPKPDYNYNECFNINIEDETTTLTNVECWLIPIFNMSSLVTADFNDEAINKIISSKKKIKWTRAEIVKFAQKHNAEQIDSAEEYRKINNSLYLECLGYAMDINGNVIARLWKDKKSDKYYYCINKSTLIRI